MRWQRTTLRLICLAEIVMSIVAYMSADRGFNLMTPVFAAIAALTLAWEGLTDCFFGSDR